MGKAVLEKGEKDNGFNKVNTLYGKVFSPLLLTNKHQIRLCIFSLLQVL